MRSVERLQNSIKLSENHCIAKEKYKCIKSFFLECIVSHLLKLNLPYNFFFFIKDKFSFTLCKIACLYRSINSIAAVPYQQQTFIPADQSAFQRAGTTGQYTITGQPSPLASVGGQTVVSTSQRQLNGQFVDPAATANQSVAYERQDYVNGYQQQVRVAD